MIKEEISLFQMAPVSSRYAEIVEEIGLLLFHFLIKLSLLNNSFSLCLIENFLWTSSLFFTGFTCVPSVMHDSAKFYARVKLRRFLMALIILIWLWFAFISYFHI